MRVYLHHVVFVMAIGLAGCTSLVQEDRQSVQVTSVPAGAVVSVDGSRQDAPTPMTMRLDPRRSHDLVIEKDCYATAHVPLQPDLGKRQLFLSVYDLVNQLPPTVHVDLTPTCGEGRSS